MFSGYSLAELSDSDSKRKNTKASSRRPSRAQVAILFLVATNVPMALYMSLVHQVSLILCYFANFIFKKNSIITIHVLVTNSRLILSH